MPVALSNTAKEVREYLKESLSSLKRILAYVMVFSFFINLLMLVAPIYMLQVFDRVLTSKSEDTLMYLTLIAAFAISIYAFLEIIRSAVMIKSSAWISERLSGPVLLPCPEEMINGKTYGSQSVRDIAQIRQFFSSHSTFSFFDVPWTPLYILVIFHIHSTLGWLSVIGALIIISLAVLNERFSRKFITESNSRAIANNKKIDVAFRNIDVIRAFGMMPRLIDAWGQDNRNVMKLHNLAHYITSAVNYTSRGVRFLLQIAILGAGAYYVIQYELTPGMMIAASIVMSRAMAPIEVSISSWNSLVTTQQAYHRLKQHMLGAEYYDQTVELPAPKGILEAQQLCYALPHTKELFIKNIQFKIKPGEILCIIGPTAAGKSTLAKLLVGVLKPTMGGVRLDGAEVYRWDREHFGRHVSYMPQAIELFPETVAKNISRLEEANDQDIIAAAKKAKAHDMILSLPNGYDTLIDIDVRLSGGQQQRIALARALFGDPKVVILDEPNASLDSQGELDLVKVLSELKAQNKTIAIVSHRPNILQVADTILLMEKGMMKNFGPKEQVFQHLKQMLQQAQNGSGHGHS